MQSKPTSRMRLDAAESAFFLRELEHIEQRSFDVKYPELMYAQLIPTRTGFDEGALQYVYRMMDEVGAAGIIHDKSKQIPRVDVKGSEYTGPVRLLADSFGYSMQEIKGAIKAGRPLDQARANTARKAIFRKLDDIAFMGDSLAGLSGLFAHSSVTATNAPTNGTGTTWGVKTVAQIIADMNAPFESIDTDTKGAEQPNTVVLPNTSYRLISQTPYSSNSDKTILQWWLAAFPSVSVERSWRLETAGAATTKRMVVYKRDPDVLELLNPMGVQQLEPQAQGIEQLVIMAMTTAGVTLRYPKAVRYLDAI